MKLPSLPKILAVALVIISTILTLAQPAVVYAQANVTFESVLVELWPEYDQPSVLVMYHFTLAPTVKLPVDVTVRIPAAAGKPHAVAMQEVAGLYDLAYTTATEGEWLAITVNTPVPEFRIEYYDPSIRIEGSRRSYTYRWPADYGVNNLTMQVQQPANASEVAFLPDLGSGQVGQDGLTYFTMLAGQINPGTTFDLQMSYAKPDDTLTNANSFQPAQPAQPVDSNTTGRVTINEVLPWALGILGLLLITAGIWWYVHTSQPSSALERPRHSRSRGNNPPTTVADSGEAVYCSQCGKRAGSGDLFCRTCGAKLRENNNR